MCLRYFSCRLLSFALGNHIKRYHLHSFFKNFTPKNEAGGAYKKDSYEKNGVYEKCRKVLVLTLIFDFLQIRVKILRNFGTGVGLT